MKKFLALILALVMSLSLVACGGSKTEEKPAEEKPAETEQPAEAAADYAVAMITDYGDITDQSFNQTTYEACKAYCEASGIDFNYFKPAGDSTGERVAMIEKAVDEGYNILVMPGFAFAGAVVEAAAEYPDVKFVVLDVAKGDYLAEGVAAAGESYDYQPDNWDLAKYVDLSNVYTVVYQEELCGYMAGYAAVKLGYTHLGFLGGMAVPAVVRYGYGFVQGADAAAADSGVDVTVEYAYGNQFFGDADITAYMDNWYQTLGVEAVFACGGGIYVSAAEAAAKVGGKVIGVDTDQAGIIDAYGEGMTITSAMKGLGASTKDALKQIIEDNNWSSLAGQIVNLGLVSGDDPESNFVQIPMESTQWADGFTQDDYKALVKDMFDGKITVSNDITAEPTAMASTATVNSYGNIK